MKKTIAIITASIMALSSASVLADTTNTEDILNIPAATYAPDAMPTPEIQGDIMLISDNPTDIKAPVNMPSYISNTVTVTEITDTQISTTKAEDAENPENTINYTLSDNTIILGYANGDVKSTKDIKKGDKITVYSNAYSPAPLIMPPQYQADVIFVEDNLEIDSLRMADVDTYIAEDDMLVNAANTLALNVDETTEIVDREGKKVEADKIANNDLAVIYSISTRSIPAQTTPYKIVVLGENEQALKQIEAAKTETTPAPEATASPIVDVKTSILDKYTPIVNSNGINMYPLREIAEANDYTVDWDGNLKAVMLNSGIFSLKIGENSYNKGKMMPMQLSAAPEIINDLTYVPADFFTEVLELN